LLPNPKKTMGFHDFDQYERLLATAGRRGTEAYLMVLLSGDAGLRLGEILALEWRDIELTSRRLTVQRSDWLSHVTVPKGGRSRQLPMTRRLTAALKSARHLRSDRVLCLSDGSAITRDRVIKAVRGAQRAAGIDQGVQSFGTRSVRTWRWRERLHGPSRSWPVMRISRRRSVTCT
jgi:integrase